jgi:hypothetical protein
MGDLSMCRGDGSKVLDRADRSGAPIFHRRLSRDGLPVGAGGLVEGELSRPSCRRGATNRSGATMDGDGACPAEKGRGGDARGRGIAGLGAIGARDEDRAGISRFRRE